MRNELALATIALSLSGCFSTPAALRGNYAAIQPGQESIDNYVGSEVRWGGIVSDIRKTDAGTCLEVSSYSLNSLNSRPTTQLVSSTRTSQFLACGAQLDTSERRHAKGSSITAVGALARTSVGQAPAAYCQDGALYAATVHAQNGDVCTVSLPVLRVSAIHVWPTPPRSVGISSIGH